MRAFRPYTMIKKAAALIGRGGGGEQLFEAGPPGFQDVGVGVAHQPSMFQFGGKAARASGKNLWQGGGDRRGPGPEQAKHEKSFQTAHVFIVAPKNRANNSFRCLGATFWAGVSWRCRVCPKTRHIPKKLPFR